VSLFNIGQMQAMHRSMHTCDCMSADHTCDIMLDTVRPLCYTLVTLLENKRAHAS
jgi:hypothetical protein